MELHDIHSLNLAVETRRDSLRRSMLHRERGGAGARRRVGGALVALGLRIAGEQRRAPARRYA